MAVLSRYALLSVVVVVDEYAVRLLYVPVVVVVLSGVAVVEYVVVVIVVLSWAMAENAYAVAQTNAAEATRVMTMRFMELNVCVC